MNKNTRQTKPLGRSTKEDNAGLSLLQPTLFSFEGQSIKYYNEISKNTFSFFNHLISKKFLSSEHSLMHFSRSHYSGLTFTGLEIQVWSGHFTIPVPSIPYIFCTTRLIHF